MVMSSVLVVLALAAQDGVAPAAPDAAPAPAPAASESAPVAPATEPAAPAPVPDGQPMPAAQAAPADAAPADAAPADAAPAAAVTEPAAQPAAEAPVAPPREKQFKDPKAKKQKPVHVRPWWSWTGIGVGLAAAAVAAVVVVAGVGTQVLALYFWYDQTNADRKQAEREFATNRARVVQWIAVSMLVGGLGAFFGGLIGATYAFGFGNPMPKSAKDM